jgi:hypothetical protein
MTKYLLVILVAGCLQKHDGVQSLGRSDCYTCHQKDYEGTPTAAAADPAIPDHIAQSGVYTTTCADCHNTITWYGHPEKLFPITTGAHAAAQCTQCHANPDDNTGDAHGKNTQCATCHPATEMVAGMTLVNDHIMHNDAIFPQNHKSLTGAARPCSDCHSGTPPTTFDGYANPPAGFNAQNFCLSCHPTGAAANNSDAPCTKCHRDAHNTGNGDPGGCLQMGCHYGGRGGN